MKNSVGQNLQVWVGFPSYFVRQYRNSRILLL